MSGSAYSCTPTMAALTSPEYGMTTTDPLGRERIDDAGGSGERSRYATASCAGRQTLRASLRLGGRRGEPVSALFDLAGRTALITGAATEVGLAIAGALADAGAR